jgi:hypothetical protein
MTAYVAFWHLADMANDFGMSAFCVARIEAIQPVAAIFNSRDKSGVRRIKEDRLHDRWNEMALSSPILRHI